MKKNIVVFFAAMFFSYMLYCQNDSLFEYVYQGNYQKVENLLKNGADPNITTAEHISPLMLAVDNRDTAMVRLLLSYNADINILPAPPYPTALENAIKLHYNEIVKMLANYYSVNIPDSMGYYPLDYAIKYKNYEALLMLLNEGAGARINARMFKRVIDDNEPEYLSAMINSYCHIQLDSALEYAFKKKKYWAVDTILKNAFVEDFWDKSLMEIVIEYTSDTAYLSQAYKITSEGGGYINFRDLYNSLCFFNPKAYKIISEKIKKKIQFPMLGRFSFGADFIFSPYDFQPGLYINIWEIRQNFSLSIGFNSRLWENRVQIQNSSKTYLQVWEKKQTFYLTFEKVFFMNRIGIAPQINTYFQIAQYRGIEFSQPFKLHYSPGLSLIYKANPHWIYRLNYLYMKQNVLPKSPHFFKLSLEYYFCAHSSTN